MIPGSEHVIEITYIIAAALFVFSLKWLSSPTTARHGVWAGEVGMVLAVAGTLLYHGIVDYKWIAIALVLGTIIGVPLGNVAMTAVPQRTALSHAFGALCVTLVGTAEFYLRAPEYCALHDVGALAGGDSRRTDGHRQLDGCRQTAGDPAAAADHLQRTEPRQPRCVGYCRRHRRLSRARSVGNVPLSRHGRDCADLWSDDDCSHWRRRYADGDLAA